ncbi:transcriptional regulator with XRE-family HTH domain [Enterococcus sp. PF1-24]|uniref:helix-turn-helix domain-containing protein n=1 Tax=unclassified Enterococcus TaxID=2608891 RepID=UPI002473FDB1|nr:MULTISPECIES: helix-turn-helix transcriptional regulator [unclassified Enterococcus]MDH6364656.1 transcriptional regulator with XRE-family HTH domain [Enterococcus sp. PFB1-1]MDH6401757.1 transcriptional regulator with XRE-family HTH domain [Enterococcus sp. PF1-24]
MSVLTRIKDLAHERNISLAELERRTGLSSGSITKWGKSSPSVDKLEKIANFFDVSLDYLYGRDVSVKDTNTQTKAKQLIMRADTNGLTEAEVVELEQEMERFFNWRLTEIKREKEQFWE